MHWDFSLHPQSYPLIRVQALRARRKGTVPFSHLSFLSSQEEGEVEGWTLLATFESIMKSISQQYCYPSSSSTAVRAGLGRPVSLTLICPSCLAAFRRKETHQRVRDKTVVLQNGLWTKIGMQHLLARMEKSWKQKQDESTMLQEFTCFWVLKALRPSKNIVQGIKYMNASI